MGVVDDGGVDRHVFHTLEKFLDVIRQRNLTLVVWAFDDPDAGVAVDDPVNETVSPNQRRSYLLLAWIQRSRRTAKGPTTAR